jgi:hypothetical protein
VTDGDFFTGSDGDVIGEGDFDPDDRSDPLLEDPELQAARLDSIPKRTASTATLDANCKFLTWATLGGELTGEQLSCRGEELTFGTNGDAGPIGPHRRHRFAPTDAPRPLPIGPLEPTGQRAPGSRDVV